MKINFPSGNVTAAKSEPQTVATDDDISFEYTKVLEEFPKLKAALPPGYPYGFVTCAQMVEFAAPDSGKRKDHYWHNSNLPLTIHMCLLIDDREKRSFARSILKTLNDF